LAFYGVLLAVLATIAFRKGAPGAGVFSPRDALAPLQEWPAFAHRSPQRDESSKQRARPWRPAVKNEVTQDVSGSVTHFAKLRN